MLEIARNNRKSMNELQGAQDIKGKQFHLVDMKNDV